LIGSQANSRRLTVTVWHGAREAPLQCPQQTVDFVDARAYLGQFSRRPGISRLVLKFISGHPMRKLL
jgi:hypothetical protein